MVELEVNKTYVNRLGDSVVITAFGDTVTWGRCFVGKNLTTGVFCALAANGKFDPTGGDHEWDIMEEKT